MACPWVSAAKKEETQMNEQAVPHTTLGARFRGLVASHLILSLTGVILAFGALAAMDNTAASLALSLLILAYFPMGAYAAAEGHWTCPTDVEKLQAVFLPALAAWFLAWTGLALCEQWSDEIGARLALAFVGMLLVMPSFGFLNLCTLLFPNHSLPVEGDLVWWNVVIFLAVFLPPLLFALGSFWQSGRMERVKMAPLALPEPPAAEL